MALNLTINMTDRTDLGTLCANCTTSKNLSILTPTLMMTTGIVGNILALVVLYTSSNEAKKTVFYTLLAGLACTDLIGICLTSPIAILVYANNLKWVGGKPLCFYHAFVMIFFGVVTPLLVCTMSLERVLALRFTYFYKRTVTKKKAAFVVGGLWLFVICFCSLPLLGFGSYEKQFPGSWCFLNYHRESNNDIGYAYTFAIFNILVIIVNMCCNIVVVVTLLQMRQKRLVQNSPSIDRRHGARRSKTSIKREVERSLVIFLCAITLVFTVCWLPININVLVNQIVPRRNNDIDLFGVLMAGINQILDPWLYILLRHSSLIKISKHIKRFLCKENIKEQIPPYVISKKNDCNTSQFDATLEIRVVCDHPVNDNVSESDDSMTSTSKLIQDNLEPHPPFLRSLSVGNETPEETHNEQHSNVKEVSDRNMNGIIQSDICQNGKNIQLRRMKRLNSSPAVFSQTFL